MSEEFEVTISFLPNDRKTRIEILYFIMEHNTLDWCWILFALKNVLKAKRIQHQSKCLDTLKQNEIAKRIENIYLKWGVNILKYLKGWNWFDDILFDQ